MKRLFIAIAILFTCLTGQAQITTTSSCDSNNDGKVDVTDVTNTANKVLAKTATETNVVTADQLNTILSEINTKLDQLEDMRQDMNTVKTAISLLLVKNGNKSIEEIEDSINSNGHDYVDLGLSVKWATCNMGASSPSDYGGYYSWGETATKSSYSWSTYTLCNGSATSLTKYCNASRLGTVDDVSLLKKTDDVANVSWGGAWRLPTNDEMDELRTKCSWTWTTQSGINGYKVTATNGNSIFLPAAGYKGDSSIGNTGSAGYYWTADCSTSNCIQAFELYIKSNLYDKSVSDRYYGQSVRAVFP